MNAQDAPAIRGVDIIAAVIIGGASLSGGVGTVLGSMIGALIMAVLRNGSNQMGWPTFRCPIPPPRAQMHTPLARSSRSVTLAKNKIRRGGTRSR